MDVTILQYNKLEAHGLQLVVRSLGPFAKVRHGHHVHHHTGPAGKVLRALSVPGFGVILLPGETSPLPLAEDVLHQVLPQLGVHLPSLVLVRAGSCRGIL